MSCTKYSKMTGLTNTTSVSTSKALAFCAQLSLDLSVLSHLSLHAAKTTARRRTCTLYVQHCMVWYNSVCVYVCVNLLQVYQGAACRSSCGSRDSPGAVCTAGRQNTGLERCEWSNHQLVSHNVTSHYVSYMTHCQAMSICHMNSY